MIRKGQFLKEQDIKASLLEIFNSVNKRETVLSSNSHGTALAFSGMPNQVNRIGYKENALLSKIENELLRRHQINQNQVVLTMSPPWTSKAAEIMGPFSGKASIGSSGIIAQSKARIPQTHYSRALMSTEIDSVQNLTGKNPKSQMG
jgi:hypothetical protein